MQSTLAHIVKLYDDQHTVPYALIAAHPLARELAEWSRGGYTVAGAHVRCCHRRELVSTPCQYDSDDEPSGDDATRVVRVSHKAMNEALGAMRWWLSRSGERRSPPLALILTRLQGEVCLDVTDLPRLSLLRVEESQALRRLSISGATETLENMQLICPALADVDLLRACAPWLRCLTLSSEAVASLAPLSHCARLTALELKGCRQLRDAATVIPACCTALRTLCLDHVTLHSLAWLDKCQVLQHVSCVDLDLVDHDWGALGALHQLQTLQLIHCDIPSLAWLTRCRCLRELVIEDCASVTDWSALGALHELRTLRLRDRALRSVACLTPLRALQKLVLTDCHKIEDIELLQALGQLRVLAIGPRRMQDTTWLAHCTALEELRLHICPAVTDLTALGQLRHLQRLHILHCAIDSIAWVSRCVDLVVLEVALCQRLHDLSPIGALQRLRQLHLPGSPTERIDWIASCRALEEVELERCTGVRDFAPLQALPRLRKLNLLHCHLDNLAWLRGCHALQELLM